MTKDPIEEEGGLNLYGFVGNDPVDNFDVLGLWGATTHIDITEKAYFTAAIVGEWSQHGMTGKAYKAILSYIQDENVGVDSGQTFSDCNRAVVGAGADEIPNAPIGPFAKSTASYLRYEIGISYRKVQRILDDLFGLSCVAASLVGFDRRAAKRGEPLYNDVREKIRVSEVVHADETSWRNDGVGHYVWFAGNDDLAFFHID